MATGARLNIKTEATKITTGGNYGAEVLLRNRGTASVHIGGSNVAPSQGFELMGGESLSVPLGEGEDLYGITDAEEPLRLDVLRVKERA